jgi:cephalosporin hydroxylase
MPSPALTCAVPPEVLSGIQTGVLRSQYRGLAFLKSPFDIGLYLQLIGRLQPRTVIEIGSKEGGSALWFADTMSAHGIAARVLSIDLHPPGLRDPRIMFLRGDATDLGAILMPDLLQDLQRPLLVVEDSAHHFATSLAVLDFFHPVLVSGDYIVIEDGVVAFLPEPVYRQYGDGPTLALADFVARHPDDYTIDRSLCDFYGVNVTYNTNGWLRRR